MLVVLTIFGPIDLMWMITIVLYIYIYLVDFSCSLKCIEKYTIVILVVVHCLFLNLRVINE